MDLPDKSGIPKTPQVGPVPQREKKEPVVVGATKAKRPLTRRFFSSVIADSPRMGQQVGREVLWPQMKMALQAALVSYIDVLFWRTGMNRPSNSLLVKHASLLSNRTPYNQISGGMTNLSSAQQAQQAFQQKSSGNYEDVVYPTLAKAQEVLAVMLNYLQQYPVVCVADLYEWSDITPAPSDNAFGWTDLSTARIVPGQGGFILELPRPSVV